MSEGTLPQKKTKVIAIDGPAASGKSTIGLCLAEVLGYLFLDTGSMYRAATLAALRDGIDPADESAVTELARRLQLQIRPAAGEDDGRHYTVILDGYDVTWDIRSPEVDAHVSAVSSYPGVRHEMVRRQREIGSSGNVVMVGRDIGTVVVPEAFLKLYLVASAQERARRRWQDRQEQGHSADYEEILSDIIRRDRIDSSRRYSPLRAAEDAIMIDSTGKSKEEVLSEILQLLAERDDSSQTQLKAA
ncbi:MAG: (d)CMP kinase [Candidatus Promineifilaceae bacterium]